MPTATFPETEIRPGSRGDDGGKGPGGASFDGSRGPGDSGKRTVPPEAYRLGMWFALGGILMLFVAFSSAYIYRQGLSFDWQPLRPLPILWFNTAFILLSSVTFEFSRRALKGDRSTSFDRWLILTALLGMTFLIGQFVAWKQLAARGIFLSTHPHSSFFYVLTGAHALHLSGGLVALLFVMAGAFRHRYNATRHIAVDLTAIYWHFMDGLWIYLFMLLFMWR